MIDIISVLFYCFCGVKDPDWTKRLLSTAAQEKEEGGGVLTIPVDLVRRIPLRGCRMMIASGTDSFKDGISFGVALARMAYTARCE